LIGLRPAKRREQARQQDPEVDEGEAGEQRNAGADDDQCVLQGEWKREHEQGVELHDQTSGCIRAGRFGRDSPELPVCAVTHRGTTRITHAMPTQ
jgi:hypothetical protein